MKPIIPCVLAATLGLSACAAAPDHFYTLNVLPDGPDTVLAAPTVHVLLSVDVPAMVDRPEMIISTSGNGIAVLEHQRWAVSFSDQVFQTLARDIEKRRNDVLVAGRAFDQGATPPVRIKVDIVRFTAQRAGRAGMEAHWRIVDESSGVDAIGGDVFTAAVNGDGYDSIARSYSEVIGELAGRLAARIRPVPEGIR